MLRKGIREAIFGALISREYTAGVGVMGSNDRDSSGYGIFAVCQRVVLKDYVLVFRVLNYYVLVFVLLRC